MSKVIFSRKPCIKRIRQKGWLHYVFGFSAVFICFIVGLLSWAVVEDNKHEKIKELELQTWKDEGCWVYKSMCGSVTKTGDNRYVCELKSPYKLPLIVGNEYTIPYPRCQAKK